MYIAYSSYMYTADADATQLSTVELICVGGVYSVYTNTNNNMKLRKAVSIQCTATERYCGSVRQTEKPIKNFVKD